MNEDNFQHVVYSKNVLEFVTVSNEYCTFLESIDSIDRKNLIMQSQKILALLYLKTSMLPSEIEEGDAYAERFVTEEDYTFLLSRLRTKLAQHDVYQEIFTEDIEFSEDALDASIAENMVDIYQDLKDFIISYRIGTVEVMETALWECKNNFETYWGQKLVNGLRAIHNLIYSNVDLTEEQTDMPRETNADDKRSESADSILKGHFKRFHEDDENER